MFPPTSTARLMTTSSRGSRWGTAGRCQPHLLPTMPSPATGAACATALSTRSVTAVNGASSRDQPSGTSVSDHEDRHASSSDPMGYASFTVPEITESVVGYRRGRRARSRVPCVGLRRGRCSVRVPASAFWRAGQVAAASWTPWRLATRPQIAVMGSALPAVRSPRPQRCSRGGHRPREGSRAAARRHEASVYPVRRHAGARTNHEITGDPGRTGLEAPAADRPTPSTGPPPRSP